MRNRLKMATAASLTILMSACATGPDYQEPTLRLPGTFDSSLATKGQDEKSINTVIDDEALAEWWTSFDDPALDRLVDRALAQNLDIAKARARVAQARGILTIAKGELMPNIAAVAAGGYQQASLEDQTGGLFRNGLAPRDTEFYQVGLDSSWELDIFGGRRRALESAQADTEAAVDGVLASRAIIAAETARTYFNILALEARISVAERSIKNAEDLYSLTSQRYEKGISPKLDVTQSRTLLSNAQALLPQLKAGLVRARTGLAVLTGGYLGDNEDLLTSDATGLPKNLPIVDLLEAPVDVLRRRPDIRAAERQLKARNADIGVATAEYFPKVTFGGAIGYSALSVDNLVGSDAVQYSIGPRISWRILDRARIAGQIRSAKGRLAEQLSTYQQTAVTAVAEVETAIAAYDNSRRTEAKLNVSLNAARETRDLSRRAYDGGIVSFLQVIDAQRQLDIADDQLVAARLRTAENVVALYKSLGGGWSEADRLNVIQKVARTFEDKK
ncbi:MAG: efflux transporter outer membrane subunit [Pseudomonadota bacterium]